MIALIDYDAGNLKSVEKALQFLGEKPIITRDYSEIKKADKIILPGVGAFGDAMEKLRQYDLILPIREAVNRQIPLLGICLGLQLLFEGSEENEGVEGLSVLPGEICHIPIKPGLKVPHMGWNSLHLMKTTALFQGISEGSYVYFVHSYYLKAKNETDVAATTEYSVTIHASVEKDQVFGCQFHPEKSGQVGLKILKNFASLNKEEN